jgi:hypothetical protein
MSLRAHKHPQDCLHLVIVLNKHGKREK